MEQHGRHPAFKRFFEKFDQATNQRVFQEFYSWFLPIPSLTTLRWILTRPFLPATGASKEPSKDTTPRSRGAIPIIRWPLFPNAEWV